MKREIVSLQSINNISNVGYMIIRIIILRLIIYHSILDYIYRYNLDVPKENLKKLSRIHAFKCRILSITFIKN